jgi:DNA-binding transcriptional LysR family regulator
MDRPNFDQLQAFSDVVELGSFSSAARRRNLTQPAVSLRVKQLERSLGVRLVERTGRRVRTTAAGEVLYDQARRIDAAIAAAVEAVADHRTEATGRIVLAAGGTACIYLLPPIISALKRAHPKLEFVVRTGTTVDIMSWIEGNIVDIALVSRPTATGRLLEVTPVQNDELVLISRVDDPFRPPHFTAALLAQKPLILPPAGGATRRIIDSWFEAGGFTGRPTMELGSIEAIKRLVRAGLGYGIVPRLAATGDAALAEVVSFPLTPRISRTLALVVRQDKHLTRGFREVIRAFQALAEDA